MEGAAVPGEAAGPPFPKPRGMHKHKVIEILPLPLAERHPHRALPFGP